jgi:hypothetical protein
MTLMLKRDVMLKTGVLLKRGRQSRRNPRPIPAPSTPTITTASIARCRSPASTRRPDRAMGETRPRSSAMFVNAPMTLDGMIGWQHVYGGLTPRATFAFASAPSTPFSIAGAPIARDALALELGVDRRLTSNIKLSVYYSGRCCHGNLALAERSQ